ncbi:MAG: hypothetical protein WBW03_30745, partial [Silvibacterium sp.]
MGRLRQRTTHFHIVPMIVLWAFHPLTLLSAQQADVASVAPVTADMPVHPESSSAPPSQQEIGDILR